jgi:hypothetical protein
MKISYEIQRRPYTSNDLLIGPVTREMVYSRTLELASLAGRKSHQIKQMDYERAKRELTGESDFDKQQALLAFDEYC